MQKFWISTMLVVLMAGLFAGGLILGVAANEPDVAALRAETAEQRDELASLQRRLSTQDAQLAAVRTELGDVSAERSGLTASLHASRSTLVDLDVEQARLAANLSNVQTQLNRAESSLTTAEERTRLLQVEVIGLTGSQRDLGAAMEVLQEIESLENSRFGVNHGDAQLLVEEGHRAANGDNYGEAAKFFAESSKAFQLARTDAAEITVKAEELAELVPADASKTFGESHRQYLSTVFAMEAQARTYEAADYIYRIIEEFFQTERPDTSDRQRWSKLAAMAEDQFELAMVALDEADTWSPGLWRRTEALRLNTRDWRNLLLGIRFNIIDVRS